MYLYFGNRSALIYGGDSQAVMAGLPAASVDAVVTDPPAGIAFMNRGWDTDKGGRDAWIEWLTGVMVEAYRLLKPGGHALVWALPRTSHWTATALEDAGFEIRDCVTHIFGSGFPKGQNVSKAIDRAAGAQRGVSDPPVTPEAATWDGWNTSLKPGQEHWWLVRKPVEGSVVANVLAHGTGALNIDACRTEGGTPRPAAGAKVDGPDLKKTKVYGEYGAQERTTTTQGRWPANLVFTHSAACDDGPCADDCPLPELDAQSGTTKSQRALKGEAKTSRIFAGLAPLHTVRGHDDEGGASRFFPTFRYQSKAPRSERPEVDGVFHPTVKSLGLMRWLVTLVTPPGGIVLDAFGGSGSTVEAALTAGFRAVAIEAEPTYLPLILARVQRVVDPADGPTQGVLDAPQPDAS